MEHKLGLEIIPTSNAQILKVVDASIYSDELPFVCPKLLVTAPGFQFSAEIIPAQNFNLTLTACDLGIQTAQCDSKHFDISDGVYALKYSVSPNEYVFVEYNHLRLTKISNRIRGIYCELEIGALQPTAKTQQKLDKINEVENYLKAAQSSIEMCRDYKKGIELYNYAQKLLDRIDCKNC
jgi:hypothetical protein